MSKIFAAIMFFFLTAVIALTLLASPSDVMLEQGLEALKTGNYSSAELIFRRLTSSNDDETKDKAWFYLAQSIFYQKNYKSSIHEFTSYLNKCRTTVLCQESRYWIAESHYHLKEYNKAIEEYKRFIDRNNSPSLVLNAQDKIGHIYFEQKRYDEAIVEWEKTIAKSSDKNANAARILNIGNALHLNYQNKEALERLAPLLTSKTDPKIIAMARIISGKIYQSNGEHARALAIFNNIPDNILKIPPYCEAHYYKALSLIALNSIPNAKSQLQIYLAVTKDDTLRYNAFYELGRLNMETGETEKGLEQLSLVRTYGNPDLKLAANKYLGTYYINNNPALALSYLEESMKLVSDDKDTTLYLAKAYISNKRFAESKKLLLQYQEKYPYDQNMDQVKFYLAIIHLEQKETKEALQLLESIKANNPFSEYINEVDLYIAIGYYDSGEYQMAVNVLNAYLRRNDSKNKYEATRLMAASHIEMNNINTAKTYINQIINNYINQPQADEIIYRFAITSEERGINASWYMNTIMTRFPDSDSAQRIYLRLGNQAFETQKYAAAINYYDKYLKGGLRESKGEAYYNKLLALLNTKKYNDVITMLKSDSIPPLDEDQWKTIPFILARCYNLTGEQERIYSMFSHQDIDSMPDDILLLFLQSAVAVGDVQLAQNNINRLAADAVARSEVLYSIGSYYKHNTDTANAAKYYQVVIDEYNETPKGDYAKYDYAEILFARGDTTDAILNLKSIKNKALNNNKNILLILCYFKSGDESDAVKLTNNVINLLSKHEYGEQVIRLNLLYYYNQKNTQQFKRFAYYLQTWFKDTLPYVNYICGKYYFEIKDYASSFGYFSKIADSEHEHQTETLFYLAEINLLFYKKPQAALTYYNRVIENDKNSDYGYKSRLQAALILRENAKYEEAALLLRSIIDEKTAQKTYVIQAENIYSLIQDDIKSTQK